MTAAPPDRSPASRAVLLYGTEEPLAPVMIVKAGRLTVMLDRGNIRYVEWDGLEVLRAISFVVRDSIWGTYAPSIDDLVVEQDGDRFEIRYRARCDGPEGDLVYHARIVGHAAGTLSFAADAATGRGFRTNRAGFVVLHGLDGVVGRAVEVEHASGGRSRTVFPELVSAHQPIFDIGALAHEPRPGLSIAVSMTGDAFEMEDQRNWTDASFKTYVRPLSRGYPYSIEAGTTFEQSVSFAITDRRGASPLSSAVSLPVVTIGAVDGVMPAIGLALDPLASIGQADLAVVASNYLVARIDAAEPIAANLPATLVEFFRRIGTAVDLDLIIGDGDDLTALASAVRAAFEPSRILLAPRRDGVSLSPDRYAAVLAEARRLFPLSRIGGGTVVGFPEFNRDPPPSGFDFVAHSTQAIVHAADDLSVMETLEALPDVIRTVRALAPDARYRIGPATIGAPSAFYASRSAANPTCVRKPASEPDPRQKGLFGAAFALGYAARAAEQGVDAITLGLLGGMNGVADKAGPLPAAAIVAGLARLAGRPRLRAAVSAGSVAAIAAQSEDGSECWLANLTAEPVRVAVAGSTFASIRIIDAGALMRGRLADVRFEPMLGLDVRLDAYAVACLRSGKPVP